MAATVALHLDEILERIFAHLEGFSKHNGGTSIIRDSKSLQRASLVCRAWREPAQRLLHRIVFIDGAKWCGLFIEGFLGQQSRNDPKLVRYWNIWCYDFDIVRDALEAAGCVKDVFNGLVGLRELHIASSADGQGDELAVIFEQIPSLEVVSIGKTNDEFEGYYPLPPRTWLAVQNLPNLSRLRLECLAIPSTENDSLVGLQRLALYECDIGAPDLFKILSATSDQLSHFYLTVREELATRGLDEAIGIVGQHLKYLDFHHLDLDLLPGAPPVEGDRRSASDIMVAACPNLVRLGVQDYHLDASGIAALKSLQSLHAAVLHPLQLADELCAACPPSLRTVDLATLSWSAFERTPQRDALIEALQQCELAKICDVGSDFTGWPDGYFASGLPTYSVL